MKREKEAIRQMMLEAGDERSEEASKLYEEVLRRLEGKVEYLVLYKKPVWIKGKEVVASVCGCGREVRLSRETFGRIGKRLWREARHVVYGKRKYRAMTYWEFMRERESWEDLNAYPVECWECGRVIPPGYAKRDDGGTWICKDGCEAYSAEFLRAKLREWKGGVRE